MHQSPTDYNDTITLFVAIIQKVRMEGIKTKAAFLVDAKMLSELELGHNLNLYNYFFAYFGYYFFSYSSIRYTSLLT